MREDARPRRQRPVREGGNTKKPDAAKPLVIAVCVCAVLGLAGVRWVQNGGGRDAVPDKPAAPPIDITADELFAEYDANEVAADNLYRGRTLRVRGSVKEIGKGLFDAPYVTMRSEHNRFTSAVRCEFPKNASGLAVLGKGQEVIVRGTCRGFSVRSVRLEECRLD